MIMPGKSPSNKDREVGEAEPQHKEDGLSGHSFPAPKGPQRLNHLPDAKIPQQPREKNHSQMNGHYASQNITESCFRPDIANGKRPRPQIGVMQISLTLIIPGQSRNHCDESSYHTAACCQNTSE